MTDAIVYHGHEDDLPDYDGVTVSFALFDATYIPVATHTAIDDLDGEISTDDAPGYARQTSTATWDATARRLRYDPTNPPTFDIDGAANGDLWLVAIDPTDSTVISAVRFTDATPFDGWTAHTPGQAFAGYDDGREFNARVTVVEAALADFDPGSSLTFTAPLVESDGEVSFAPSGTPTGAKFLRDDGSWATPPSGGEGGSSLIEANVLVDVDDVDGTDGPIRFIAPSPGAEADADAPADFVSTGAVPDHAAFGAMIGGATVKLIVARTGLAYSVSAATIDDPWELVAGNEAVVSNPFQGLTWAGYAAEGRWWTTYPASDSESQRLDAVADSIARSQYARPGDFVLFDAIPRDSGFDAALTVADALAAPHTGDYLLIGLPDSSVAVSGDDYAFACDTDLPALTNGGIDVRITYRPIDDGGGNAIPERDDAFGELLTLDPGTPDSLEIANLHVRPTKQLLAFAEHTETGGTEEVAQLAAFGPVYGKWVTLRYALAFDEDGQGWIRLFLKTTGPADDTTSDGTRWRQIGEQFTDSPTSLLSLADPHVGVGPGVTHLARLVIRDGVDGDIIADLDPANATSETAVPDAVLEASLGVPAVWTAVDDDGDHAVVVEAEPEPVEVEGRGGLVAIEIITVSDHAALAEEEPVVLYAIVPDP